MAEGGGGIMELIKEHPGAVMFAVIAVVLLAYFSRSTTTQQVMLQPATDPNAGAYARDISLAQIQAQTTNVSTLASLFGLEDTNKSAVTTSLAQTQAGRDVQLAAIEAAQEVQDQQTQAGIINTRTNANAQTAAAALAAQLEGQMITAQQQVQTAQVNASSRASDQAAANQRNQQNNQFWASLISDGEKLFQWFEGKNTSSGFGGGGGSTPYSPPTLSGGPQAGQGVYA